MMENDEPKRAPGVDPTVAAQLVADIVIAYLDKKSLEPDRLIAMVTELQRAIVGEARAEELGVSSIGADSEAMARPAVAIEDSICPDHIVCLEDGLPFRSLKRHLLISHDMTPETYRTKWSLPDDYPMAAPNYSRTRAEVAKRIGLGGARPGKRKRADNSVG